MSDFDPTLIYTRDASWHPRSKAGGKMPVYHAICREDPCMSACSPTKIMLNDLSAANLLEVSESELCKRPGCRRAFEAMRVKPIPSSTEPVRASQGS